jgi:hypothetical protein
MRANRNRQQAGSIYDKPILLGKGLAPLPKSLLDSHAKGEVMLLCGAGVSQNSQKLCPKMKSTYLPDFRSLVIQVYEEFDIKVHSILVDNSFYDSEEKRNQLLSELGQTRQAIKQKAEIERFCKGDYDVVLGMIEKREEEERFNKDSTSGQNSRRSDYLQNIIAPMLNGASHHDIHKALIELARRGRDKNGKYITAIATTNFDRLLEDAAKELGVELESYSLGEIPTPEPPEYEDFSGIFHIHGVLNDDGSQRINKLILTDRDFGEWYLRKKNIPDFIYDVARNYSWVLVGYRANDPPMRYLLNAIANDRHRHKEIQKRYVFLASDEASAVERADWEARDITPIVYDVKEGPEDKHIVLVDTLMRWAQLSPANENNIIDQEIIQFIRYPITDASDDDINFVKYFLFNEKMVRLSAINNGGIHISWLELISEQSSDGDVQDKKNV